MINDWFDFAIGAIGAPVAFLCLFEGVRRIGAHGISRNAALMTVLAASLYVLYGSFAYWKYQDLVEVLSQRTQKPVAVQASQATQERGKKLSPEKKEAASLRLAQREFVQSGALGTYVNRRGEKKLFAPNQDDIKGRERIVAYLAQVDSAARNSFTEAMLWLITGLLAVLFGYVFSREKLPSPAKP
jgi:hypothetical protein